MNHGPIGGSMSITTNWGGSAAAEDGATLEVESDRHREQGSEWVSLTRVSGGQRYLVADLRPTEARGLAAALDQAAHVVERRSLLWGWFART